MSSRKYEFVPGDEVIIPRYSRPDNVLKRIRRISDGVLGGFIEKESNLSHEGTCWVGDLAYVMDESQVIEDAQVLDEAWIEGSSLIGGEAVVGNRELIIDEVRI